MMTMNEMADKLRQLDLAHREDGDGGYALLGQVLQLAKQSQGREHEFLRDELLHAVAAQNRTLWGVALEALVQHWKSAISANLASLLDETPDSEEWESHVLLALLRLRCRSAANRAVTHISKRIASADRTVLPLLAALSAVDPERCLAMSASFVVDIARSGQIEKLEGYMAAFVNHFLDNDSTLLASLVQRISRMDRGAGANVAAFICEYLNRPYARRQLGDARVASLVNDIEYACGNH